MVHLYPFALVGLIMIMIGDVQLIDVGLPLFGYHWAVIRRERAGF